MEEEFHNHMRIPWHDYTSVVLELCFYLAELEHGEYEVL